MSASSTPTSRPRAARAAAMLTVRVDLPTPPFPEATARTRVVAGNWTPRTSAPPRSCVVSAARSSGDITSNASETDVTPGSVATCSCTWSSKLERSGQPATVSAIMTATAPPSIVTSRTIPSSVTGFRSSGSITRPSACRICSCVATCSEGSGRPSALGLLSVREREQPRIGARVLPEQVLEVQGVLDRVTLPVVVEVAEDVDVRRPGTEALRPSVELGVRVVSVCPVGATVEPNEREVRRQLVRLEIIDLRPVSDHECHVVGAKERVGLLAEPRRVTELEGVPVAVVTNVVESALETLEVALEGRRQLPEERAELGRAQEGL